jgi:hypothetical protein
MRKKGTTSTLAQNMFKIRLEVGEVGDDLRTRGGILDLYSHANPHSHYLASHEHDWAEVRSHRNENRYENHLQVRVRNPFYL